ncbi:response regulator [Vibrio hippocampi]|uniref:histidine kinase n=1 Tax=Vibrio hippocampi TaxID=654686 RepID=A0ABM8ZGM6_9VIBR|nr:response regulator [Vibrio hippocampi]CAH0525356.1 Sensor histidine kinase RcsC [Vibrio hippocampi]
MLISFVWQKFFKLFKSLSAWMLISLSMLVMFPAVAGEEQIDDIHIALYGDLTPNQIKNIAVELKYFDDVMTSSVLSYAFSSDEKWLDRYYEYEPKLTELINALLANKTSGDAEVVADLEQVNLDLVDFEMRAIDLVQAGRRQEAMELINGEDYLLRKNQYMGLLLNLANKIERRILDQQNGEALLLSADEKQWIANHKVRVGIEHWPPMLFKTDDGSIGGLAGAIINQIVEKTGLQVELVEGEWSELLQQFYAGEIDVLPHSYKNLEREQYGEFTTPYFLVRELFFVRKKETQYKTSADLANAKVAISQGYTTIDKIKTVLPNIQVVEAGNIDQAIQLVLDGKADAVLDAESVIKDWLARNKVNSLRSINEDVVSPSTLHLLSSNQLPLLHSILQRGLDSLKLRDLILTQNDWLKPSVSQSSTDETLGVADLGYLLLGVVVILLVIFIAIAKALKVSDQELANKFGSKKFKNGLTLAQVVLCIFLILITLVVTGYAHRKNQGWIQNSLDSLLDSTHDRMTEWVDIEINTLERLANNRELVGIIEKLVTLPNNQQTLLASPLQTQIRQFFDERQSSVDEFGFFVISPDKISLASSRDSNVGTINLIQQQRPDLLEAVLSGDSVFIPPIRSDVMLENVLDGSRSDTMPPTMFFAVPAKNRRGEIIGILTKRVNFDGFFSSILSAGFIGSSGETYAIDRSGLLLSNVRFEEQLHDIGLIPSDQSSSLNLRIADPGVDLTQTDTSPNPDWPLTLMARGIANKNSGNNLAGYRDYRGVEVVGTWVWDERLGIGIAAEIDQRDVFAVQRIFDFILWSMLALAIVLMLGSSMFTFRLGSRATRALTRHQAELESLVSSRTAELRLNAKRTQTIIDNASDGIIVVDVNGNIAVFSPAAEAIFGYAREEVIQSPVSNLMSDSFHQLYLDAQTQGEQINVVVELTGYCKQGETIDIEVAIGQAEFADDYFYTGIVRDATKRKASERELMLAKQKAEEATQAKSDFLANMSHEIRTPMNAIIGMSYLAMQTDLNRKQAEYVNKIQISAESLLGIINDILDFSKIEAGKLDLEAIDFNLHDSIDNLVQVISQKSQQSGVELLTDISPDLPVDLVGDPLRLGQILLNLANNAIKFTDHGEIIIKAEPVELSEDSAVVQFSVKDTGIGMSPEQVSRLFQSFSQADASTTRKYGGTGLGLSISKTLTELMKGKIWVESEQGKGSTFIFTAHFGVSKNPTQSKRTATHDVKDLPVLIVDDSVAAREILHNLCVSLGFDADVASTGAEALEKLVSAEQRGMPIPLVLADWKMPHMDGVELARRVGEPDFLQVPPHMVMVTAYDRDEMLKSAGDIRIEASMTKPVSASTLLDTVLRVMGKRVSTQVEQGGKLDFSATRSIAEAKVLLVEDNEINQEIATELLTMAGLEVVSVWNGQEAVERVASETFDAVLMDIQMPVMDGYEATRAIRGSGKFDDLPIIAMTANAMAGDKERCIEAGMNDHLPKPIDPQQVYRTLAQWITSSGESTVLPTNVSQAEPEFVVAGVDTKTAIARMAGNVKAYKKTLMRVAKSEADIVERMNSALAASDLDSAIIAIHSLKGVAGNIGAMSIVPSAEALELRLLDNKSVRNNTIKGQSEADDEVNSLIAQVGEETAQVIEAINEALEQDAQQNVGEIEPTGFNRLEFNRVEFERLTHQLLAQVDDYDTSAVDTFDTILETIGSRLEPSLKNSIATALSHYDFDSVPPLITQMLEQVGNASKSTENAQFVETDLEPYLNRLSQQIEQFDSAAVETLDELFEHPLPETVKPLLEPLRDALSQYDFDQGEALLPQITRLVLDRNDNKG